MPPFSHRQGIVPTKPLQVESIDHDLRNSLWNALMVAVWNKWSPPDYSMGHYDSDSNKVNSLFRVIWILHFKKPLDEMPPFDRNAEPRSGFKILKRHFLDAEWWAIYDLIEFILEHVEADWRGLLRRSLDGFLSRENSGYRIVDNKFVPISDPHEVAEIEAAIQKGLPSIRKHLEASVRMISDRKNPDYRNAVKEAISAVEATYQHVSGKEKGTLPDCLKAVKGQKRIHPAFEAALSKLYAFTSDAGGIRHALGADEATPSLADARFMLVTCSAFVNYILAKFAEFDLPFNTPR